MSRLWFYQGRYFEDKMKSLMKDILLVSIFLVNVFVVFAQKEPRAIQVSGTTVAERDSVESEIVPYVSIAIKGSSRGTVSDIYGHFSFLTNKGDTIVFSAIGYQTTEKIIPRDLSDDKYFWQQTMRLDNYLLPEAVIAPWPSKGHFKYEVLALDIDDPLRRIAEKNLDPIIMKKLLYTLPADGGESYRMQSIKNQRDYMNLGQKSKQIRFIRPF